MLKAMGLLLCEHDLVIDVGANIGNHTLYLASVVGCDVIAFEPNPLLCAPLRETIRANALDKQVTLIQKGVGKDSSKGIFEQETPANLGGQSITLLSRQEEDYEKATIDITTLDSFNFKKVKAIKIDVEGMELDVLIGAKNLLELDQPALFIEAQTEEQFVLINKFLTKFNYIYWETFNATPTHSFLPRMMIDDTMLQKHCFKKGTLFYQQEKNIQRLKSELDEARKKYRSPNKHINDFKEKLIEANEKYRRVTQQYNDIKQSFTKEKHHIERILYHNTLTNEQLRLRLLRPYEASLMIQKVASTINYSPLFKNLETVNLDTVLCVGAGEVGFELAALCSNYDVSLFLCLDESPLVCQTFIQVLAGNGFDHEAECLVLSNGSLTERAEIEEKLKDLHNSIDLIYINSQSLLWRSSAFFPTITQYLAENAHVWMDDTIRQEEKDVCERWAADYGFELEYFPLEKGLGRLTRPTASSAPVALPQNVDEPHPERALGLDFSLPDDRD